MSGAMATIGGLLSALAELDADAEVYIDNLQPTALSSYRGYYSDLAIERASYKHDSTTLDEPHDSFEIDLPGWGTYSPGSHEVKIKSSATVGELTTALNLAIGATFEGYKGGQFTMDETSKLWVSERGQCDGLVIAGIERLSGRVDLVTKAGEDW